VANGLTQLEQKKYKLAAEYFLNLNFEKFRVPELISVRDVAVYGALFGLVAFERKELKDKVINNLGFNNFLENVPEVKELLYNFYNHNYSGCFHIWHKLRPSLEIDIHLHDHLNNLYEKIRSKSLVQYFFPFLSVDLKKMATAFNTTVSDLEKELCALIMDGSIKGRIDSQNKILYARQTDQRSSTFESTLKTGVEVENTYKTLLLRMSIHKAELIVKQKPDEP